MIAPEINIHKNFVGTIQAIASKKIIIDENVLLKYPSSVIVNASKNKTNNKSEEAIIFNPNSTLEGSVIFFPPPKGDKKFNTIKTADIFIKEKVNITGQVYCNGILELLGSVSGSLYTEKFIARQYGSKYINHIYNGSINNFDLKNYCGIPLSNKEQTIAKWLY